MAIKRVGIVGSGIMGSGIAEVAAKNGFEVVLRSRAQQSADAMVAGLHEGLTGEPGKHRRRGDDRVDDLVVFEPLLRAAARLDGSLGRVDSLLTELAGPDGRVPNLSPAFLALWSTVWDATKEMQP